ncbi:MAG TPA: ABC transporter transmembrane domain-containing protein [Bacteriovoracaceae bacterium]|nr:ABC transporter transmembrane domain-containing protein [Bacteriovoracaceae bacterium]
MKTFKKLARLSRNEWPLLGWGIFFLVISSAALLAYPHFIKRIIDEAIATSDQSQLNIAALMALGIFAIQSVTSALRYYFFTLAGEQTVKRLRSKLFSQIIGQDTAFFDGQKTGELIGRLSSDTAVLQNALSVNISMLVRSMAQAAGGVIMLFLTSAKLTVFILMIIPPIGLLAARFGKKVKALSRRSQDSLAHSSGVAEEGIASVRTVKAFAQEAFEVKRYEERLETSFAISREKIGVMARFTNLVGLLGLTAVVFIVWYGGTLVIKGEMTIGTLTSFLLYVITVAFSVGMLGSLWSDFMSAIGASDRIFEILEKSTEDTVTGRSSPEEGHIEFKDVFFAYPTRPEFPVLKGVNFTISPHETIAVVGSSGAGKSTLVQLLLRSYEPKSGTVLLDGINSASYSLKAIRESIGVVSQEPVLVSESLFDNIRYGRPDATQAEVESAANKAFAHDFIVGFPEGYKTLVGERGVQLSGGQKQRVAIARALLKHPKILILDEATSALDAESEHLVQKALENMLGKRTILIIAHRLSTVKRADKILVMHEGQVVQVGTHSELLKEQNGFYHKLIQRQFEQNSKENT